MSDFEIIEKLYYDYYVAVLSYVYCPESMQTISMIERCQQIQARLLYLQTSLYEEENPFNNPYSAVRLFEKRLNLALGFVKVYYDVTIPEFTDEMVSGFISNLSCEHILTYLRANARNMQVKKYFDL